MIIFLVRYSIPTVGYVYLDIRFLVYLIRKLDLPTFISPMSNTGNIIYYNTFKEVVIVIFLFIHLY